MRPNVVEGNETQAAGDVGDVFVTKFGADDVVGDVGAGDVGSFSSQILEQDVSRQSSVTFAHHLQTF